MTRNETDMLVFNLSHDIRTPVNTIMGFTEMALRYKDDPEKVEECLRKVKIAAKLLVDLVDDVHDLARLDAGVASLEPGLVSIKSVMDSLTESVDKDVRAHVVNFSTDMSRVVHNSVYIVGVRLKRLLVNAVSMTVKNTNSGSNVKCSVKETASDKPDHSVYEFSITDDGIGINEELLATLRERGGEDGKMMMTANGFGLSLTDKLLSIMNGTFEAKNMPGVGTSMVFRFEWRTFEDGTSAMPGGEDGEYLAELKGSYGLIVDDNELNRQIAKEILGEYGIDVDEACDGLAAVEKCRDIAGSGARCFDFILMDARMPVMDGYEATKEIRKLQFPGKVYIPIIAMTANAFAEDREAAIAAGMDEQFAKPVDISKLRRAMGVVLKKLDKDAGETVL